ncbi:MAG TPA: response regulator [Flavobacteriia bacterium]|nr:response regulator [Flavobacteriia bacterium]
MKLLFNVTFLFSITIIAQNEPHLSKEDLKDKVIYNVDRAFASQNTDTALYHAKKSLFYAKKIGEEQAIMISYDAFAYVYKMKNDFSNCEKYIDTCLQYANKLNDSYYQFLSYNMYGIIKFSEKQYQLSTEYYNKALKLAQAEKEPISISLIYQNIALNYYLMGEFEIAKTLMFKAKDVYDSVEEFKDPLQEDSDYIYLYMKLSLVADTKEEALKYANLALQRAVQSRFNNYISLALLYKGRVYYKHAQYNSALQNFKKALSYNKKASVKSSDAYIEVINTLSKLQRHKEAKKYLDTLLANFSEKDIRPIYIDKYKLIAQVYKNYGDLDKALQYTEKRMFITDSLLKHNNYSLFAEYGKKFETKEKEKEIIKQQLVIEKQANEKKVIILYGGVAAFLALLLIQWRFNSQKIRKKDVENAFEKERDFNQMRTTFLENISHEIRTPLTLINGYLNLIDEETKDNPKVKEYIDNALVNSKKVIFDADEILNLLKFEDLKMSKNIVSVPLNDCLKQLLLSFEIIANARNIKLVYSSTIPNDYIVKTDADKVEKILSNLISNAIKFSDSNSKVMVEATVNEHQLIVKVIDFGMGIDAEDQERIFSRFYQSKNNKAIGGIGIGLLLAKDFAQFLGGNITVKSKVNQGSTFTFTMPLSTNGVLAQSNEVISTKNKDNLLHTEKEAIDTAVTNANKPSILIVEDNIEMSNYLKRILSPFYNCSFAFNGLEGIELAKKQSFDLIASDIMMPKIDGYEFRKLLKSLPEYTTVPFILITAKSLSEDKTKGFSIGIDDYITKPFNKEELIIRINNLLKNNTNLKLSIATPDNVSENNTDTHVEKLLKEIEKVVLDNLSNENFKVEDLAAQMNYSQRQLSRILNRHTGLSTVRFIQEIKLREAYKLIENKKFKTISEVQYAVGITSSSYFSEKFKSRFGINPSELMRK